MNKEEEETLLTIAELASLIEAKNETSSLPLDREITCGYTCDLLSWVMAHGEEGMAWVTVQTHMNVVAVAVLADMACVIMPENIDMPKESIDKAADEGLVILKSPLSAYAICGRMAAQHIPEKAE